MTVSVRRLRADDDTEEATCLLIAFFAEEGFVTAPGIIRHHAAHMAKLDACGLFQAEADGQVVGVATASLQFGIEYGWTAEMGDLYVAPSWRGRGIAGKLIEVLEAFLISKGAAGYQVTVTADAEQRHGLTSYYRRLGFRSEERRLLFKSLR